ncbi:hypothetical protein ACHAQJ_004708 [Trichoderma viride]
MGYATRILRREVEKTDHPIGLGWLLAIALCGGILLFTTIGLLLVWWVKKSRHPGPQMVYGYTPTQNSFLPPSSSRLIKRRLLGSESISKLSSRFSSRFSFSGPQTIQPPLPTHESFRLPERRRTVSRGRKRSRSWVDEDDLHGPKMVRNKKNARESWFGRDGRFTMVPTLPNVGPVPEKGYIQVGALEAQDTQPRWLVRSQTEPRLTPISNTPRAADIPMGMVPFGGMIMPVPVPPPVRIRPSATDSNLKGILRSTDMRLSERSSRSPVKISRSSAVRGSPTKTSCSSRAGVSARSSRGWRTSGSPPKRGTSQAGSRNNSISSIDSAANSLIIAATQELELPGGTSSPSKAKAVRWEQQDQQKANASPERAQYTASLSQSPQRYNPQRQNPQMVMMVPHKQMQAPQMQFPQMQHSQAPIPYLQHPSMAAPHIQQHSPQKSPERRMSLDSDKSSSLSTLYSANEPEEEEMPRQRQEDDPFVEKGGPRRWPSWQVRQRPVNVVVDPSHRRVKTLNSVSLTRFVVSEPSCPPPLRPISGISQPHMGCSSLMPPLMLEPQTVEFARGAGAYGSALSQMPYLFEAPSEVSFVSMSVDSDATEVPAGETSRVDWLDSSDSASSSPTTPTGKTRFPDMSSSSSPYDEREIMSLLMATAPRHRSLPLPPPSVTGPDGSIITILSPPPRGGGLVRQASTSSSIYTLESFIGEPGTALSTSPSRRSVIHPFVEGPRVSNTVAELRRMNSMISTYSVASLASTVAGEGDSPTLPASLSGGAGLTASRSVLFGPGSIGSRHYLNVGNTRSMVGGGSLRYGPRGSRHRRAESCHFGKENQGLGLRLSCIMDETLDLGLQQEEEEDTQGVNLVCEPAMEIIEGIPPSILSHKLGPVEQLIAAEQRENLRRASVESLGLYDNDGFLLSSPERDAKRRGLRI